MKLENEGVFLTCHSFKVPIHSCFQREKAERLDILKNKCKIIRFQGKLSAPGNADSRWLFHFSI